jgi:hypothetical protein
MTADKNSNHNISENINQLVMQLSGDGITPSRERQPLPDLPQSLVEWLTRFNQGYLALVGKISF